MPVATWNNAVIARAAPEEIEVVEGNVYFPLSTVNQNYLSASDKHTVCGWKGTASYYHLMVDGQTNLDAAWFYPEPKEAASQIAGRVAFWRGVQIRE